MDNGITKEQVLAYNACIREGSERLWRQAVEMINKTYQSGRLQGIGRQQS